MDANVNDGVLRGQRNFNCLPVVGGGDLKVGAIGGQEVFVAVCAPRDGGWPGGGFERDSRSGRADEPHLLARDEGDFVCFRA